MKKIISIILGIMLMFAMSVTSFAATDTYVPTVDKGPDYVVTIDIAGPVKTSETTDLGTIDYKCYTFTVEATNNTSSDIKATDFAVQVKAYNSETKAEYPVVFDYDKMDVTNVVAHTGGSKGSYTIPAKINTNANLYFEISVDSEDPVEVKTFTADFEAAFLLVKATEEDVTPPATESDPTDKEDTSTEDTDTTPPADDKEDDITPPADEDVNTPDTDKGDEDVNVETPDVNDGKDEPADDSAPVDPEIPDTGATVPFAAIGTLVTSAITALVAKKKKEN